jgi:hypothetical protein
MNHNKKRNVGIIYELLVKAVSAYLVEDDKSKAQIALDILGKHYNKKTELFKEFRLFQALAKSTVKDTSVAAAILAESKAASRRFNSVKLNNEKSDLIREINYNLKDQDFYHRNVPDYRIYATIQTLLNSWREGDRSNLSETVVIESNLVDWLKSDKQQVNENVNIDSNVDKLVVKIMNEKFNDKYANKLTLEQKNLINDYVFSMQNDEGFSIKSKAIKIQQDALKEIKQIRSTEKNPVILEKIDLVERRVNELDFLDMNDDKIVKLMTLTQLINEIKED